MKRLLEISKEFNHAKASGKRVQNTHMCILRSDYMVDWPVITAEPRIKLVEYNTIAVSMLPLADKVQKLHRYVNAKYHDLLPMSYPSSLTQHVSHLPFFQADYSQLAELTKAFKSAIDLYR